jgi:hypothetical protein
MAAEPPRFFSLSPLLLFFCLVPILESTTCGKRGTSRRFKAASFHFLIRKYFIDSLTTVARVAMRTRSERK